MNKLYDLREYLIQTKNDWNYITPMEFYNKYVNNYLKQCHIIKYYSLKFVGQCLFKKHTVKCLVFNVICA